MIIAIIEWILHYTNFFLFLSRFFEGRVKKYKKIYPTRQYETLVIQVSYAVLIVQNRRVLSFILLFNFLALFIIQNRTLFMGNLSDQTARFLERRLNFFLDSIWQFKCLSCSWRCVKCLIFILFSIANLLSKHFNFLWVLQFFVKFR